MAGQVLLRVGASGVNPLDIKIRAGKAAHAKQPLPAVLGLDMAGVVEEIGEGVTAFRPGDEVYGMVGGVGGLQGTLAEFVVASADLVALKPRSLSMREAAALPLVTITAWEGMVDRAKVHEGQRVLVHAGAGGVGHVAVQLAKAFGAEVFATVSAEKRQIVEGFGATAVDYRALSTEQYVAQYAGGEGFDVVYDTVGGATIDSSFVAVKRYTGHVVSCLGWSTHSLAPLSFRVCDVLRCVYADALVEWPGAGASWGDSSRGSGSSGGWEATAVDECWALPWDGSGGGVCAGGVGRWG